MSRERVSVRAFLFALLCAACLVSLPGLAQETIAVTATGYGRTPRDAERDAIRAAVQQAVGAIVDAETLTRNEEVINDQVLTYSDGLVQKILKTSDPVRQGDVFAVTVEAVVEKGKVTERLQAAKVVSVQVAGEDLWARAVSQVQGIEDGRKLLEKLRDEYPLTRMLVVRAIDKEGRKGADAKPEVVPDPDQPGQVTFTMHCQVYFNLEIYYREFAPKLVRLLGAIGKQGKRVHVADYSRDKPGYYSAPAMRITGEPARLPFADIGPLLDEMRDSEDGLTRLLVNIGRDRLGLNQRFRVFDLPAEYQVPMRKFIERSLPVLSMTLVDNAGTTLNQSVLDLALFGRDLWVHIFWPEKSYDGCRLYVFDPACVVGMGSDIMPYYGYLQDRAAGYDSVVLPFSVKVHQDDLKDLATVRLAFQ
jgi:hypothetical protein